MRRVVIACLFVGACARVPSAPAPKNVAVADSQPPAVRASCARRTEGPRPVRVGEGRQGGAVVLARAGDRLLAYVADADSRSIHTLSIDWGRELARTRLDGAPRQLLVLSDGRVAATLSDGTRVAVLEPPAEPSAPLAPLCTREVAAEPWGIALSPDDHTLVVTSGWGAALTAFDAATLAVKQVVPLARDPRGVLVDDRNVAFVTHLVGATMSAVDLDAVDKAPTTIDLRVRKSTPRAELADMMAPRTGSQAYAIARVALRAEPPFQRVLVPMVSVDPGDPERRSSVYYGLPFDGVPKQTPMVSVVDPATEMPLSRYLLGTTEAQTARECLLPRAAAVRAADASLLVACYGIDALVELDALAADPFRAPRRRFDVPPGPEGVAVDEDGDRAVVFSQMGAVVSVIPLDGRKRERVTIPLDYHPDPALAAAAYGRQLFYRTDDTRISGDGIACSSCHVDGREDGLTWTTPMGPRQTPMLAGRLRETAPYGWEGDRQTLMDYIENTVVRLGGKGLSVQETSAIAQFLLAMPAPPPRSVAPWERALVERGHDLFEADGTGCTSCHGGEASTDATSHGLHDDRSKFDTPSLRFVRGTAPYFHDGRYPTLEALLADPGNGMGHAATLPSLDRAAIAAYLRTL
jgi:DNA-binding beta-propeller fold protein YncE